MVGYKITGMTSNTVTIQLAGNGFGNPTSSGGLGNQGTNFSNEYIKFVVSAGGGGGGFLYDFLVTMGTYTDKWNQTTRWLNISTIRKLDSNMPDITEADIFTAAGVTPFLGRGYNTGVTTMNTITIDGVTYNMMVPSGGLGYILRGPVS